MGTVGNISCKTPEAFVFTRKSEHSTFHYVTVKLSYQCCFMGDSQVCCQAFNSCELVSAIEHTEGSPGWESREV